MRRRSFLSLLLLVGLVAAVVGGVGFLVKQEPAFYHADPDEAVTWDASERSSRLVTRVQDLKNDVRSKAEWGDTFGADDLNCFFRENMGHTGGLCTLLPKGLHAPRVAIDGDRLRLGFRYGEGFWSVVVWVELKVWLVANETNVVAVELCDLKAGGLPIGTQSFLDSVTEAARDSNIEVTWYRHKSNPVGVFRLYADQTRPSSQVMTLEVKDGTITIAGRSTVEPSSAAVAPVGLLPAVKGPEVD